MLQMKKQFPLLVMLLTASVLCNAQLRVGDTVPEIELPDKRTV